MSRRNKNKQAEKQDIEEDVEEVKATAVNLSSVANGGLSKAVVATTVYDDSDDGFENVVDQAKVKADRKARRQKEDEEFKRAQGQTIVSNVPASTVTPNKSDEDDEEEETPVTSSKPKNKIVQKKKPKKKAVAVTINNEKELCSAVETILSEFPHNQAVTVSAVCERLQVVT
jgi:hypothetical protein